MSKQEQDPLIQYRKSLHSSVCRQDEWMFFPIRNSKNRKMEHLSLVLNIYVFKVCRLTLYLNSLNNNVYLNSNIRDLKLPKLKCSVVQRPMAYYKKKIFFSGNMNRFEFLMGSSCNSSKFWYEYVGSKIHDLRFTN